MPPKDFWPVLSPQELRTPEGERLDLALALLGGSLCFCGDVYHESGEGGAGEGFAIAI